MLVIVVKAPTLRHCVSVQIMRQCHVRSSVAPIIRTPSLSSYDYRKVLIVGAGVTEISEAPYKFLH